MQNIYQAALNKKKHLATNLSIDNKNYFKLNDTFKKGKIVYLNTSFNFNKFINNINIFLQNNLKLSSSIIELDDYFTEIQYKSKSSLANKINAETSFSLIFLQIENILIFNINLSDFFNEKLTNKLKLNFSSLINSSFNKEISHNIFNSILNSNNKDVILSSENAFFERTHTNEKLFFQNTINNEQILAKLNLSNLTVEDKEVSTQIFNSSFVVTDKSIGIFAFNKNGENVFFEKTQENYKIKKGITSNTIIYKTISWNTKRSNSKSFNQLKNIYNFTENNRIEEFARLAYLLNDFNYAQQLISLLKGKEGNAIYDFLYLLVSIKSKTSETIKDDEIKPLIQNILLEEKINKLIFNILKKWKISNIKKTLLLELFTKTADSKEEKKAIIPLFETIRTEFKKNNKDLINQSVFEINYAEFLISCGKNRKAGRILKQLLKNLPNETISEILPPQNLDITSNKSGQLLKIKILDLITKSKGKDKAEQEILQSAILQPLNINTLNKLKDVKSEEIKEKANEIISLLSNEGLNNKEKEVPVKKYKPLSSELIENNFRHPATLKNGSFYSIQKWISKIKEVDYSSIKEYAEKIEATSYPKLNEIFYNLKQIFKLENVEFYISRGKKSHEIIGYEGKPSFVLIGYKHLDKNSDLFLNFKELQFAVSVELAHIYFKHSKISANDVWRGVADKGYVLLDAVLGVIPVAGLASKSIRSANKLNGLTKILNNSISVGKNIYGAANKVSEFYKNKFISNPKTQKKQKLLVASRLMQYTADRAGLAISGDLKTAVRTTFLTGKYNYAFFDDATKTSLNKFILQTNEDGTYKNQEIALRIAHLISFYLSDEYTKIRTILLPNSE